MPINNQPEDLLVFDRLRSSGRISHGLRRLITQQWNICVSCKQQIANGRPAFAGYNSNSNPLFVGACCAHQLSELASPIYWADTLNLSVPDNQTVWRYMDFSKFMAVLQQGGLYLPRADKLDDPFEGATGLAARQAEWDEFYLSYYRNLVLSHPPGYPTPKYSKEQIESQANTLLQSIKAFSLEASRLLVSCWHGNNVESEALWRLYSPPPVPGIAIRSTVGKLWHACAESQDALVGRVHYVDFRRSFASIQKERIFQKRQSLSHESEVRIVLQNDRHSPAEGKLLICDLNNLISDVTISPFAPPWFLEVVSRTIEKYEYSFALKRSELLDQPFF